MKEIRREFDMLSKEERTESLERIIAHFLDERDEELDIIGADEFLDMFLQRVAPYIYNKAIDDARAVLAQQSENTDFELSVLKK
ncbi:MAG: DUF2164 domain-containing protein [Candidatus Yonathbacteria bacterium]|nr:DUF2164 domain-containing protein [Candidatus Yonathbacteria bacterium]